MHYIQILPLSATSEMKLTYYHDNELQDGLNRPWSSV